MSPTINHRAETYLDGAAIRTRYITEPPAGIAPENLILALPIPRFSPSHSGSEGTGTKGVTICVTSAGSPTLEAAQSWMELAHSDRHDDQIKFVFVPSGPYMDQGRNKTIFHALASTDSEWLLTLDDDISFTPRQLAELVNWASGHHIHVAGGVYASPHNGRNYAVAYRHDDDTDDGYVDLTLEDIDAMDPRHPETCRVAAIGTGFLLVHRSVYELMRWVYHPPQPWFAELTVPMPDPRSAIDSLLGTHLGEDLTFCRRLWAINIPVHVAPHVRLTHHKKLGITLPPHPLMA